MEYFENKPKIKYKEKFKYKIKFFNNEKMKYWYIISKKSYNSSDSAKMAGNSKIKKLNEENPDIKYILKLQQVNISKKNINKQIALKNLKKNEIYIQRWNIIRVNKKYSIEEVLSKYNEDDQLINFDGDLIPMGSDRYANFKFNGIICRCCGLKGEYFYKERFSHDKGYHFNLYAIDMENREVLMTKDHFIPKSKGGPDHINNYQPFCENCNKLKGSMDNREFMEKYKK